MNEKNLVWGKNPVIEILEQCPSRINKIYIQENISLDNRLKKIIELAKLNKIVIEKTHLKKLQTLVGEDVSFQKVVASTTSIEYMDLEDFLAIEKNDYKRLLILDSIQDPHNFGAIIRTAAAAGLDGIVVANHRSAPITSVVEKISSGAINHIPIIKTTSLSACIDTLKKHDYWVIATQMQAKDNYFEIDYSDMNFAIVMGSEGSGISKTILNKADFTIKIMSNFESLNVSAACAVIVYEAMRQIYIKNKK